MSTSFFGYCGSVIAMPQANIAYDLNLGDSSDSFYSIFISIHYVGCAFGGISAGKISDRVGRRGGLILSDVIGILGCLMYIFPTTTTLLIGRIITGFAAGITASIPALYIKEISPPEISGKTGCLYQICSMIGILTGYLMGLPLPISDFSSAWNKWWIVMLMFPILQLSVSLFVFLVYFKNETPAYSIVKCYQRDLTFIISELYEPDSIFRYKTKLVGKYEISEDMEDSPAAAAYNMTYQEFLFDRRFRKMLVIGFGAQVCQQWIGNNAIVTFATRIFESFSTTYTARIMTVVVGFFNLLATTGAIFLIDGVGRKGLLRYGCLFLCLILLGTGYISYMELSVVYAALLISLFMLVYGMTIGAVTWVYCGEVLTDAGISLSVFFAYCNLFLLLLSYDFIASYGLCYTFWLYATTAAIFYAFYSLYLIETKGLTKEEICEALVLRPKDTSEEFS
eukprot:CAMPEP_0204898020 /NCGR_PEP_ID=MMETSP1397-20131031/1047_1 /ASSEMBLY_ACC=CAM_ASM_000891 /TAXON_ID=49980 /ORGANISM="Climacostomum Climacostomum virens, Strain Stock W-24" /LENGTH=451 /DNA_ID=CAMNT_0052065813 /DNA_START=1 /DNA_END=1356 /DNA_ORIENTATION=+